MARQGYDTSRLGKKRRGFYIRKRDDFPQGYVHYNLGSKDNKKIAEEYRQKANQFHSQITARKLAERYAARVQSVYKSQGINQNNVATVLSAGKYFKNSSLSDDLNAISSKIMTNVLAQSGVGRMGSKKEGDRRLVDSNKRNLSLMSSEATTMFNNLEKMMEKLMKTYGQNDFDAYLVFLKDLFKGEPSIQDALNSLGGKNINKTLSRKRIEDLNKGMKGNFENIQTVMNTLEKQKMTLAQYVQGGKTLNFGEGLNLNKEGGTRAFKVARLVDIIGTAVSTLGGAMFETLYTDILNAQIVKAKNAMTEGVLLAGRKSGGVYLNSVKASGSTKAKEDKFAFAFKTTDLEMSFKDVYGNLKIDIPVGVSLKKSAGSTAKHINNISIKTGSLGRLMNITRGRVLNDIWTDDVDEALSNIFANHNAKHPEDTRLQKNSFKYGQMNSLLNKLNLSFIVAGLAGSLTSADLATVLIVNDNVYNIWDIIKQSNMNSIVGGMTLSTVSQMQNYNKWAYNHQAERKTGKGSKDKVVKDREAALTRSNNFYWDAMMGRRRIHVGLKLNMKLK